MSRSRKQMPVVGITTARSDQPCRATEHRRERRTVRTVLSGGADDADKRLHHENYGNPCKAPKDGKQIWRDARALRK